MDIAILCGGPSTEHEVSIKSARNIYNAINKDRYNIHIVWIDKKGKWSFIDKEQLDNEVFEFTNADKEITVIPGNSRRQLIEIDGKTVNIDVVFPILHGSFGEDGTLQGILKAANIPFVGCGLTSSALCMDKSIAKNLWTYYNINVTPGMTLFQEEIEDYSFQHIKAKYGVPFFVKPANSGSSIWVSKIKNEDEYKLWLEEAFKYDNKILIEKNVWDLEIEVSVIGRKSPVASTLGAIKPKNFYTYEEKYESDVASCIIPAPIDTKTTKKIQDIAIKAYKVSGCEWLARIDFFLQDDEVYLNEINTMPGFTNISMFPKLFEYDGIEQSELLDTIIGCSSYYNETK